MNRHLFRLNVALVIVLLFGCTIKTNHNQKFDSNYNIYTDTSQAFVVEEIIFNNPVLLRSINYGPWLITEERNLNDVLKDKSYINRPDVYLYGNYFSYYSNVVAREAEAARKYTSNIFYENSVEKETKLKSINKNLNGFEIFKFECDSNSFVELRFILGFISVNRYNKLNNYQNSYQFKSRNINTEYRKIVYPFCVYKK